MGTERRDVQNLWDGLSCMAVATSSVTALSWMNFSMTSGFTPRRTFNTSTVTTAQLAEVVATALNDLFAKR